MLSRSVPNILNVQVQLKASGKDKFPSQREKRLKSKSNDKTFLNTFPDIINWSRLCLYKAGTSSMALIESERWTHLLVLLTYSTCKKGDIISISVQWESAFYTPEFISRNGMPQIFCSSERTSTKIFIARNILKSVQSEVLLLSRSR